MDPAHNQPEPAPSGTTVELRNLTVRVAGRPLVDSAHASFQPGKIALIVGSSGAGKSVLLRILAGLIGADHPQIEVSGSVLFDGRESFNRSQSRPVGVVFQNFALFDELSPLENVRFAQAHRRAAAGPPRRRFRAAALLEELRVPRQVRTAVLSGGQRQRLAIARTLAYDPDVILYDEPTSGLDVATAAQVAALIESTHGSHPKTSIVVTHDIAALTPIAEQVFLLDAHTRSLREIPRGQWSQLAEMLHPAAAPPADEPHAPALSRAAAGSAAARFFAATTRVAEEALRFPLWLVPRWPSPAWGLRYLLHYLRLVAGPSAWLYIAIAGAIAGYVTTYFTFRFLPYAQYTRPLLIENLLEAMGFALYRILVPVLATVLIAARCGAAVASDVGGKRYGQQIDALSTFGVRPQQYLLTGVAYAFLLGTPLLTAIGYFTAGLTSLVAFTATQPQRGPEFWELHYHSQLVRPGQWYYAGSGWLLAKVLLSAAGIALIAYHQGARPKYSTRDVSHGITTTILWATLYVLIVHFAFAFHEFD